MWDQNLPTSLKVDDLLPQVGIFHKWNGIRVITVHGKTALRIPQIIFKTKPQCKCYEWIVTSNMMTEEYRKWMESR